MHPPPQPPTSQGSTTLAAQVTDLLERAQVPLTSKTVRILLGTLSGKDVKAEHLGRIAAYERERLLNQRAAPRLCAALAPDGTALVPRVWCVGTWVLGRRVRTDDVVVPWLARGAQLCAQVAEEQGEIGNDALRELTLELVAEALGPGVQPRLGSAEQWHDLKLEMGRLLPGPGVAQPSIHQEQAATALDERLSAVALYFGSAAVPVPDDADAGGLQLVTSREGEPLIDLLRERTRDTGRAAELATFLMGIAMLARARRRPVSAHQYAELNGITAAELRRLSERWEAAVPEDPDPQDLAWRLSRELDVHELHELLRARVAWIGEPRRGPGVTLHDPLTGTQRFDEREARVLDDPPFQRLRTHPLFAFAQLRHPAVTTTLFEHSLRCAVLAGDLAHQTTPTTEHILTAEVAVAARMTGLLRHVDATATQWPLPRLLADIAAWASALLAASAQGLSRHGVVAPSLQFTQALRLDDDGEGPQPTLQLRSARGRLREELVDELECLHRAEIAMVCRLERDDVIVAAGAMAERADELLTGRCPEDAADERAGRAGSLRRAIDERRLHRVVARSVESDAPPPAPEVLRALERTLLTTLDLPVDSVLPAIIGPRALVAAQIAVRDRHDVMSFNRWRADNGLRPLPQRLPWQIVVLARPDVDHKVIAMQESIAASLRF